MPLNHRFAPLLALMLLLWQGLVLAEEAEPQAGTQPLIVGVKPVPPFAMRTGDGDWRGVSVALWQDLADRLGVTYQFREYALEELLSAVASGEVDVGLGAITVTAARERRVDFSQPFFQASLGIAVPVQHRSGLQGFLDALLSRQFLTASGTLLLVLAAVGAVMWLIERRRNPDFGGRPVHGLGDGLWWSAVTMTTVGYGDKAPRTFLGRAVAVVWMFASIIIIASMTGAIASAFTVSQLESGVQGPADLARHRIATVADSTSERYLREHRIRYQAFATLPEALDAVAAGALDAVVYDAPAMRYRVNDAYGDTIKVLPDDFRPEYYALALPPDSPLREPLNRELIDLVRSSQWEDVLYGFFGE